MCCEVGLYFYCILLFAMYGYLKKTLLADMGQKKDMTRHDVRNCQLMFITEEDLTRHKNHATKF